MQSIETVESDIHSKQESRIQSNSKVSATKAAPPPTITASTRRTLNTAFSSAKAMLVAGGSSSIKVSPASLTGIKSKSGKSNEADELFLKINAKCILGSRVLLAIAINLIAVMLFTIIVGRNSIVYSSPAMMGVVYIGMTWIEQFVSVLELKLLAVSIEPIR
jgi:hypothetical protein